MKYIQLSIAFLVGILLFPSCQKDIVDNPNNTECETDLQQFEAVWNGLNTAYVFWPIDTTDWDAIYEKYRPIFAEMDDKPDIEWRSAWLGVTSTLMDHHMEITIHRHWKESTTSQVTFYSNPGYDEVISRNYYHSANTYTQHRNMLRHFVDDGRMTDSYNVYFDYNNEHCCSGILDNQIAYIYIHTFKDINLDSLKAFQHFRQLVVQEGTKAAIIDVRDNGGGNPANLERELSCFTTKQTIVGFQRTKIGLGRYDLSPAMPVYAYPGQIEQHQEKDIPVVILTNINSASMSESTAIAFQSLPLGYVVGERTFGAFCPLSENNFELFYSGSFGNASEGYYIKTANYLVSGPDGKYYEGVGVTPDKECLFDQSAWDNGIDNQLECAIEFAKEKTNQ